MSVTPKEKKIAYAVVLVLILAVVFMVYTHTATKYVGTWTTSATLATGASAALTKKGSFELTDASTAAVAGPYVYKFGKLSSTLTQADSAGNIMSNGKVSSSSGTYTITWVAVSPNPSTNGIAATGTWTFKPSS